MDNTKLCVCMCVLSFRKVYTTFWTASRSGQVRAGCKRWQFYGITVVSFENVLANFEPRPPHTTVRAECSRRIHTYVCKHYVERKTRDRWRDNRGGWMTSNIGGPKTQTGPRHRNSEGIFIAMESDSAFNDKRAVSGIYWKKFGGRRGLKLAHLPPWVRDYSSVDKGRRRRRCTVTRCNVEYPRRVRRGLVRRAGRNRYVCTWATVQRGA